MYKCTCGATFSEPDTYCETHGETFSVCPSCKSTDYEESPKCDRCGEYFIESRANDTCEDCLEELEVKFSELIHENFNEYDLMLLNIIFDGRNLE